VGPTSTLIIYMEESLKPIKKLSKQLTIRSDLSNRHGLFKGHVAEVGEDHQPGVEAGEGIHETGDETISVAVVGEGVVGRV